MSTNLCLVEYKNSSEKSTESFELPLFPKLTQEDIAEADRLRNAYKKIDGSNCSNVKKMCKTLNVPERLGSGNLEIKIKAAPIYVRDKSKKKPILNMKRPLEEGIYRTHRGGLCDNLDLVPRALARLTDGTFVDDAIINAFSNILNLREVKKRKNNPKYKPVHMENTYLLHRLCLFKPEDRSTGLIRQTDWSKVTFAYNPTDADRFTNAKRQCTKTKRANNGGLNFFECRLVIFPLNEYGTHFVFFCVEPLTLRQKFYDSCHGRVKDDKLRMHVSQKIHQWMKHQHQLRHNKKHPKSDVEWSMKLVQDRSSVLKNSHQGGTVDCGLHTCVVPLLIADNKPLNVFGKTAEERRNAGIEMRRRMILSLQRSICMFETRSTEPALKDLQELVAEVKKITRKMMSTVKARRGNTIKSSHLKY